MTFDGPRRGTCDLPGSVRPIAGWKTNSMFRRYDIVDGRDLKEAGRKMEERRRASSEGSTGTISGTAVEGRTQPVDTGRISKALN